MPWTTRFSQPLPSRAAVSSCAPTSTSIAFPATENASLKRVLEQRRLEPFLAGSEALSRARRRRRTWRRCIRNLEGPLCQPRLAPALSRGYDAAKERVMITLTQEQARVLAETVESP